MATRKLYDITVLTGQYTVDGIQKGRFENIGAMFESDRGKPFITIKRTFNPAGVEAEVGRDSIICSLCEPRPRDGSSYQKPSQPPVRQRHQESGGQAAVQEDRGLTLAILRPELDFAIGAAAG